MGFIIKARPVTNGRDALPALDAEAFEVIATDLRKLDVDGFVLIDAVASMSAAKPR